MTEIKNKWHSYKIYFETSKHAKIFNYERTKNLKDHKEPYGYDKDKKMYYVEAYYTTLLLKEIK